MQCQPHLTPAPKPGVASAASFHPFSSNQPHHLPQQAYLVLKPVHLFKNRPNPNHFSTLQNKRKNILQPT